MSILHYGTATDFDRLLAVSSSAAKCFFNEPITTSPNLTRAANLSIRPAAARLSARKSIGILILRKQGKIKMPGFKPRQRARVERLLGALRRQKVW